MRPAAFILGAKEKLRSVKLTTSRFAWPNRALKPGLGFLVITSSPKLANTLFSPITDTTSAPIATATKSVNGIKNSRPRPSLVSIACKSLKPTPHPHSSLKGYGQSRRLGSKTATALGSSSPGVWWSQITISTPKLLAKSTSSIDLTPQSRAMIKEKSLSLAN